MQGTAERRSEIMKLLCRRRSETIRNLAFEFEVSERTIRRDIEILSLNEPIYTQVGRYGGGVYVEEGYPLPSSMKARRITAMFISAKTAMKPTLSRAPKPAPATATVSAITFMKMSTAARCFMIRKRGH